jgi:hypothetical protein
MGAWKGIVLEGPFDKPVTFSIATNFGTCTECGERAATHLLLYTILLQHVLIRGLNLKMVQGCEKRKPL